MLGVAAAVHERLRERNGGEQRSQRPRKRRREKGKTTFTNKVAPAKDQENDSPGAPKRRRQKAG